MIGMGEIYKATSSEGKSYIGQAVFKLNNEKQSSWGAKRRWEAHVQEAERKPRNECLYLNNAIRKYGAHAFQIDVIFTAETIELLNEAEERLIIEYNTLVPHGYNLRNGGTNKIWTDQVKEKIRNTNLGKKRSEASKEKMRECAKTRKCKYSDEHVNVIMNELQNGLSKIEVSDKYNVPLSTLRSWLNGNRRKTRTKMDSEAVKLAHESSSLFHDENTKTIILEKLREGVSSKILIKKYKIPGQTISQWKKRENIAVRMHVVHKDVIKQAVIEFVKSGNTKAEAARKFNVPCQTVSRWTHTNPNSVTNVL
jgi:transposase